MTRCAKTLEQAFWAKVQKAGADECWPWTGAAGPSGHGQLRFRKKHTRATAVAWKFAHGDWPPTGKHLCHKCDNPPCCNPAHLFLGTPKDNMQDCIDKGRFRFLAPRRGVLNNKARLTWELVAEVRRRYSASETISELARLLGFARSTLREVVNGRNWQSADVPRNPRRPPSHLTAKIDRQELVRLYKAGVSRKELAAHFGASASQVSIVLCRLGFRARRAA